MKTLADLGLNVADYPKTYQWDSAKEWGLGTGKVRFGDFEDLIDSDMVQERFQAEMGADGFFEPEGWVDCPQCQSNGCVLCEPFDCAGHVPPEVAEAWEESEEEDEDEEEKPSEDEGEWVNIIARTFEKKDEG